MKIRLHLMENPRDLKNRIVSCQCPLPNETAHDFLVTLSENVVDNYEGLIEHGFSSMYLSTTCMGVPF